MADKYINKVIYGEEVLIDLTADTVDPASLLSGVKAHDRSGAVITGTCTYDSDTTDADAGAAEILLGKSGYVNGAKVVGTMPNKGSVNGTIATKDGQYTIPMGFHDGSGKVSIDPIEKDKLIAQNIREGVTVLGVTGTMSGAVLVQAQSKSVTPSINGATVIPDANYNYLTQVVIAPIPYSETNNSAGGTTVTIGV